MVSAQFPLLFQIMKDENSDYKSAEELKKEINPAELIETLKQSEGVRWPGAIFLMALTLLIGFGLAYLLLFSRSDTDTVSETDPIEEPGITQPINEPPNVPIIIEEEPQTQIPLIGQQLINGSGTFTEWYTRDAETDTDLYPRFVDLAWHPGTERIYLAAHDKNLYWIDSSRTHIESMDISLQIGESLPFLDKIATLDQDRLLLLMSNNDQPFVIYNIKTNRVEKRFGAKSDYGELGTFDQIQNIDTAPNGTIYVHNRYEDDGEWADQMQVFDAQGNPIHFFPLAERFADAFAIDAEGTIVVIGGYNTLYEYDLDGALLGSTERDNFQHTSDMGFDAEDNLYFVRAFEAWLIELQPDGQFGRIYGPAHNFDAEKWDLGQVRNPAALIAMSNGQEFVLIDGFDQQRVFLFEPK